MGYETKCDVRVTDSEGRVRRAANATVLLETDELIVRGEARVRVPRADIREVTRRGGTVTVASQTLHVSDAALLAQLADRTPKLSAGRSAARVDVAFVQVTRAEDLTRIAAASKAIVADGAIWVVHPKGPGGVADTTIFAEANRLGLTYTKVARISEAESAEKLVWPRAARSAKC